VNHIFDTLKTALNYAKKKGPIFDNPCSRTEAPAVNTEEMEFLDAPRAIAVLRAFQDSPVGAAVATAVGTGLRRSELLALTWGAVDLDAGTIDVLKSVQRVDGKTEIKEKLKTKKSRRQVAVPEFVVEAVCLSSLKRRQSCASRRMISRVSPGNSTVRPFWEVMVPM
jgi:integrase